MQNAISYMECAIRFNVSSTIIVLFEFTKKQLEISKKAQNLENDDFDEKNAQNKKDVKFDFASDIFYTISSILNGLKNKKKKLKISKTVSWMKKVHRTKKM